MKKILAIVLVLAFVLSLGSMVLAETFQEGSWLVKGWNAFYADSTIQEVDWVRPIYYDAGADTLYVLTQLVSGTTSAVGAVYVDNFDGSALVNLGNAPFDVNDDQFSKSVILTAEKLKLKHAITVIVNTSAQQ
jgi:hypothetical protein